MKIELERKKLELRKVETSKMEMEFKILERLADIDRIKDQIKLQEESIETLKKTIEKMEEN